MKLLTVMLLAAALLMFGCQSEVEGEREQNQPETTTLVDTVSTPSGIPLSEIAEYRVIRAEDADEMEVNAARDLRDALKKACTAELMLATDFYREGLAGYEIGEKEILVGQTNREETALFLRGLRADDYGYGMVNGKLVIAGHTANATKAAVALFCREVIDQLAEGSEFLIMEDTQRVKTGIYDVESIQLCGRSITEYTIVYPAENLAFEKTLAELLADRIAEMSGYILPVAANNMANDAAAKIAVGGTSSDLTATHEEGCYLLGCETATDPVVIVAGEDSVGNAKAVVALIERMTPVNGEKSVSCDLPASEWVKIDDTGMTAMSFNVYVGNFVDERKERVRYQILSHLPDTFGVQEASDNWMVYLRSELSGYYACVGIGRDNGTGEHSAVFYAKDKFNLVDSGTKWLSATPDVSSKFESSSLNRIFTYAILERKSDGARIMHLNTHFDHKSEEARSQQAGFCSISLNNTLTWRLSVPVILTPAIRVQFYGRLSPGAWPIHLRLRPKPSTSRPSTTMAARRQLSTSAL